MSRDDLDQMVMRTLEMQNGGKITISTAWDMPFIPLLPRLIHDVTSGADFSEAGCCIGAGAEIFAKKVDSLHVTTLMQMVQKDREAPNQGDAGAHQPPHMPRCRRSEQPHACLAASTAQ
jgi:hypothetical protein